MEPQPPTDDGGRLRLDGPPAGPRPGDGLPRRGWELPLNRGSTDLNGGNEAPISGRGCTLQADVWWKLLIAYVAGAIVIGSLIELVELRDQQRYSALATHGVHTAGHVTLYQPDNHDNLEFSFMVDGLEYSGGGSFHVEGQFTPGQPIDVTYEAGAPENNCACDPKAELANAVQTPIVGGFWLAIMVPIWYLAIWAYKLRPPRVAVPVPLAPPDNVVEPVSAAVRRWSPPGFPAWFWMSGRVEYELLEPVDQAIQQLQAGIRPDTMWAAVLPIGGGLVGWVSGSQCQLTTRTPLLRNSFETVLDGHFVPAPNGCRLIGSLHPRAFAVAFLAVWVGLATIIGTVITISVLLDPSGWHPSPPPAFFGLIFPLFGIGLGALMRWMAAFQERRLLRQIDEIFGISGRR